MLNHVFKFQISKQYLFLTAIIFLSSLLIVETLPLALPLQLLLILMLTLYVAHFTWRYVLLRSSSSIIQIKHYQHQWEIQTNTGTYEAELDGQSTLTGWVSVLRFRTEKKVLPCIVFRDSLMKKNYRQMLVAVRFFK